ncbi:MAG: hypothetical protein ACRD0K_11135 [Egibacteraceae bacterium]
MAVDKLRVSVSAWLSAAQDRIRNRLLRVALDELGRDVEPMSHEEAARLVAEARQAATITRPGRGNAA